MRLKKGKEYRVSFPELQIGNIVRLGEVKRQKKRKGNSSKCESDAKGIKREVSDNCLVVDPEQATSAYKQAFPSLPKKKEGELKEAKRQRQKKLSSSSSKMAIGKKSAVKEKESSSSSEMEFDVGISQVDGTDDYEDCSKPKEMLIKKCDVRVRKLNQGELEKFSQAKCPSNQGVSNQLRTLIHNELYLTTSEKEGNSGDEESDASVYLTTSTESSNDEDWEEWAEQYNREGSKKISVKELEYNKVGKNRRQKRFRKGNSKDKERLSNYGEEDSMVEKVLLEKSIHKLDYEKEKKHVKFICPQQHCSFQATSFHDLGKHSSDRHNITELDKNYPTPSNYIHLLDTNIIFLDSTTPKTKKNNDKVFEDTLNARDSSDESEDITQDLDCVEECIQCPSCKQDLSSKYALKNHIKAKHNNANSLLSLLKEMKEPRKRCPQCKKHVTKLSDHLKKCKDISAKPLEKKKNSKKLVCQACNSSFSSKYYLKQHIKNKHQNEANQLLPELEKMKNVTKQCTKCGVYYANLSRHLRSCKITTLKDDNTEGLLLKDEIRYKLSDQKDISHQLSLNRNTDLSTDEQLPLNDLNIDTDKRHLDESQSLESLTVTESTAEIFHVKGTAFENPYQFEGNISNTERPICPECNATFVNKSSLISHVKLKHVEHKEKLFSQLKHIKCTAKRCPFCGEVKTNLSEHKKTCKDRDKVTTNYSPKKEVISAICPECNVMFYDKSSLKKHVEFKHPENKEKLLLEIRNMKTTNKKCPFCGLFKTHLYQHKKVCKMNMSRSKYKVKDIPKPLVISKTNLEIKEYAKNGKYFLKYFDEFMNTSGDTLATRRVYKGIVKRWIKHWETEDDKFVADKMLNYCDTYVEFPEVRELFTNMTLFKNPPSSHTKKTWCNVAIKVLEFLIRTSLKLYAEGPKREDARIYFMDCNTRITEMKNERKKKTKEAAIATKRSAEEDKRHGKLKHNPDRMLEIVTALVDKGELKETIKSYNSMPDCKLENEDYETRLRNIILGTLIIFGGGTRPSTYARIKRIEFEKGMANDIDGEKIMTIACWEHKTSKTYGSATVVFMFPGLYSLTEKYLRVYKKNMEENAYLLGNKKGHEPSARDALAYVKDNFLKNICSKEELAALNPEDFRHAVADWNTKDTSEVYRTYIAPRFQSHSAQTRDSHYVMQNEDRQVIGHLRNVLNLNKT